MRLMAENSDEADVMRLHEPRYFVFSHGLGIAVDEKNFVLRRRQALEQKHPQVRHEIARDAVRAVQKNVHVGFSDGADLNKCLRPVGRR
jgi:hypothetical protein